MINVKYIVPNYWYFLISPLVYFKDYLCILFEMYRHSSNDNFRNKHKPIDGLKVK